MATIAVGDVHGCLPALVDLLDQLRTQITAADRVVFLGDYIDRGPDTKGCLETILAFRREVNAAVVCLCGNHEDWLLRTLRDHRRHSWLLGMEAFDTIRSYSVEAAARLHDAASRAGASLVLGDAALPYELFFEAMPASHLDFLERLSLYDRGPDCICAHGGLDPRDPRLEHQGREAWIWGADGFPDQYGGADTIVYGHRNNAEVDGCGWPRPKIVGKTIGIDTIGHGVLTAVRLPDGRLFQSAQYESCRRDVQQRLAAGR
jgi:serine/threonine protein phosphatase 1